jgi:aminocarboxymuconate-semialdehyde decarboxylase
MFGCIQCQLMHPYFPVAGAFGTLSGAEGGGSADAGKEHGEQVNWRGEQPTRQESPRGAIDFHTHLFDEGMPTLVDPAAFGINGAAWLAAMRSPEVHIHHMELTGVSAHVVGVAHAVHGITWGNAGRDLELYRASNDRIAREWVGAYPGRFFGAFGVPTQDIDLSIRELKRSVIELGLSVLQVSSCSPDGQYYGDPFFDPLWSVVESLGVPIFVHPHGQASQPPLDQFFLSNSVGQGIEEIKVMTSMIYNGVFEKFPRLKVVIAHGGGFLPHYYGRMDRNAVERPQTIKHLKKSPSQYLKHFYYDSCVYGPSIMKALIDSVGAERIVLGSDFPVGDADGLAALRATPGLSEEVVKKMSALTPARLLERRVQHQYIA